jgi:DNA-binding transcriptional MocR family regulator
MNAEPLLYEKLAAELSGMIAGGVLRHGERLPSLRRLSQERRLSVSTVVQAFRQLEDRGLVEARPQSGYFVKRPLAVRPEPSVRATPDARSAGLMSRSAWCGFLSDGMKNRVWRPFLGPPCLHQKLLPVAALQRLYAGVGAASPAFCWKAVVISI